MRTLYCRHTEVAGHSEETSPRFFTADVVFTLAHLQREREREN